MNLKDQGFRFVVDNSRKLYKWAHPADQIPLGWTDCTNMDDDNFFEFMTAAEGNGPWMDRP